MNGTRLEQHSHQVGTHDHGKRFGTIFRQSAQLTAWIIVAEDTIEFLNSLQRLGHNLPRKALLSGVKHHPKIGPHCIGTHLMPRKAGRATTCARTAHQGNNK
jgi:hypothetical protein